MPVVKQDRKLREISVSTNIHGVPLSLMLDGRRQNVSAIYEQWREYDELPDELVTRDCFRIKTGKGMVCDIYRDKSLRQWYICQVYQQ